MDNDSGADSHIVFRIVEEQSTSGIGKYVGIVPESGILFLRQQIPPKSAKTMQRIVVSATSLIPQKEKINKEAKQMVTVYLEIGKEIVSNSFNDGSILSRFNTSSKENYQLTMILLALFLLLFIVFILLIIRTVMLKRASNSGNGKIPISLSRQIYSLTATNKKRLAPMAPPDCLSPSPTFDRLRLPPPPLQFNNGREESFNSSFKKVGLNFFKLYKFFSMIL